jgi:hypothetical protein
MLNVVMLNVSRAILATVSDEEKSCVVDTCDQKEGIKKEALLFC